ncbi:M14 family zinc carboxypeptidase [uncultured Aquimarina sp.]|uniref:M14 family zinc carboxypeptidase n=1 Tax=uncultured Aquimarina sp. TaxID=575652 RepID=UPI0026046C29|nr:M14 family zinc carboxypeptidase [uncultured Aquimarina sp.]
MKIEELKDWFTNYKQSAISGRYIHLEHIKPLIDTISQKAEIEQLGSSENDEPIYLIKIGTGSKKLLFWSQMHGNESTTTKAIFDFLKMLSDDFNELSKDILKHCTLYIIPILSPDGARLYTRLNYNKVDLNRDAQNRTQKESIVLRELIDSIQPDYAFNLHGQRTIFSAGETKNPATVSFLSPAGDEKRTITTCRKIAMEIIAEMNTVLQQFIPNRIGRYDDGFNINCVGDTLSTLNVPTILFEAGHFDNDYDRERTREYIFYALVTSVSYIAKNEIKGDHYKTYFDIPENGKLFYDIIVRDAMLNGKNVDIAIQYTEELSENSVKFIPKIVKIEDLQNFYGHREINADKRTIQNENVTVEVVPENELLKFRLNDELFSTELTKS